MSGAYFRFIMRHMSQLTVKQTNSVQWWVKCFLAAKGRIDQRDREKRSLAGKIPRKSTLRHPPDPFIQS